MFIQLLLLQGIISDHSIVSERNDNNEQIVTETVKWIGIQ